MRSRILWLLMRSEVGPVNIILSELNKDWCQRISLTAVNVAMNSISTVNSNTDICFLEPHDTAALLINPI